MGSDHAQRGAIPLVDPFKRLHPSSLVFGIGRHAKALLLPIAFVIFFARESSWERWIAILFVPSAAFELYRYATTRYRLSSTDLVLRRGLFFRSERNVPLDRIQNVDLVQNPLHRLLGVAEVRVETAAGASPEAILNVLTLEAAERLRGDVMAGRRHVSQEANAAHPSPGSTVVADSAASEPTTASSGSRTIHRISTGQLLLLGLISNRGMALVLVALGAAWELDLLDRIEVKSLYEQAMAHPGVFSPLVIGALALAAILGLRLLSAAWAVLRFHGYQLEAIDGDLRMRCGLLTRITATVPRRRIQLLSMRQTLLQRWLGCVSVRIETAGGTGGGDADESRSLQSRRWFVPTVRERELPAVLDAVLPGLAGELRHATWQGLSARGRRRMLKMAFVVSALIAAAVGTVSWLLGFWWIAAAGLAFSGMLMLHAIREARFIAFARTPRGILFRSGALTQQISATFCDKLQVVSLRQSPFDRRWGMATLSIDTAGAGPAEHAIHVPYQPEADARRLQAELVEQAELIDAGAAVGPGTPSA